MSGDVRFILEGEDTRDAGRLVGVVTKEVISMAVTQIEQRMPEFHHYFRDPSILQRSPSSMADPLLSPQFIRRSLYTWGVLLGKQDILVLSAKSKVRNIFSFFRNRTCNHQVAYLPAIRYGMGRKIDCRKQLGASVHGRTGAVRIAKCNFSALLFHIPNQCIF